MKTVGSYLVLIYSIQVITTLSIPPSTDGKEISNLNKSEVDRLVFQQTEAIKKIVSDKQQIQLEYPQVKETEQKSTVNTNSTTDINLEDLRIKCQHLERLFKANNSRFENDGQIDSRLFESAANVFYRKKFPSQTYPVYFQGRKDKIKSTTPKIKGFYVTSDSVASVLSTTPRGVDKDSSDVKYIKLEPVILQKTFLNNGKVVYYWHKSLPSAIHYSGLPLETEKTQVSSTTHPTTTTSSSIYSFKNFFPFYSLSNSDPYQTTTESTTTSTSTTPKPYSDLEDLSTQLRFVVPVPYMNSENVSKDPWDFDQFAYYPKLMQPNKVNIQVPYVPTFHVIKALAVPNKYLTDTSSNQKPGEEDKSFSNYGPSA